MVFFHVNIGWFLRNFRIKKNLSAAFSVRYLLKNTPVIQEVIRMRPVAAITCTMVILTASFFPFVMV
jgi:hypothetical protein